VNPYRFTMNMNADSLIEYPLSRVPYRVTCIRLLWLTYSMLSRHMQMRSQLSQPQPKCGSYIDRSLISSNCRHKNIVQATLFRQARKKHVTNTKYKYTSTHKIKVLSHSIRRRAAPYSIASGATRRRFHIESGDVRPHSTTPTPTRARIRARMSVSVSLDAAYNGAARRRMVPYRTAPCRARCGVKEP